MSRNDLDGLWNLDAGALAQSATHTKIADMGLFQPAHPNGDIWQRAGPITHTTGFTLKGQAQLLINPGLSHLDLAQNS